MWLHTQLARLHHHTTRVLCKVMCLHVCAKTIIKDKFCLHIHKNHLRTFYNCFHPFFVVVLMKIPLAIEHYELSNCLKSVKPCSVLYGNACELWNVCTTRKKLKKALKLFIYIVKFSLLTSFMNIIQSVISGVLEKSLKCKFYMTFWALTLFQRVSKQQLCREITAGWFNPKFMFLLHWMVCKM